MFSFKNPWNDEALLISFSYFLTKTSIMKKYLKHCNKRNTILLLFSLFYCLLPWFIFYFSIYSLLMFSPPCCYVRGWTTKLNIKFHGYLPLFDLRNQSTISVIYKFPNKCLWGSSLPKGKSPTSCYFSLIFMLFFIA